MISKDDGLAAIDGALAYSKEKKCSMEETVAIIRGAVLAMKEEPSARKERDSREMDLFEDFLETMTPDLRDKMKNYKDRRFDDEMFELRDCILDKMADSMAMKRGQRNDFDTLLEGALEGFLRGMRK